MIKLEELKPIIEPLLTEENTIDVIEKIKSIDVHSEGGISEVDLKTALEKNDAEWKERYKKTFFGEIQKTEIVEEERTPEEPENPAPKTYGDLFKEKEE